MRWPGAMAALLLHVLVARIVLTEAAISNDEGRNFDLEASGSLVIGDFVSSSLINESGVGSDIQCLVRCQFRGCAVAVFNKTSRACQLTVINDESSGQSGPEGTHVTRHFSSPIDGSVMLWKAEDFELLMRNRCSRSRVFSNSSTGRLGVVQSVVINVPGCYRIEAFGAAGGFSDNPTIRAGSGASATGSFSLIAGTRLDIVVGQAGGDSSCCYGSGGGGGSFVFASRGADTPLLLLAAGGGGGASCGWPGMNGNNETRGMDSNPSGDNYAGRGGSQGEPGLVSPNRYSSIPEYSCGGPGAGWIGSAVPCSFSEPGGPGLSREDGWLGGARANASCLVGDGGFGGGGAAGGCCMYPRVGASGGGGGFSGGGAASHPKFGGGGGGGSFCSGRGCVTVAGANSELQGRVLLNWTASARCG